LLLLIVTIGRNNSVIWVIQSRYEVNRTKNIRSKAGWKVRDSLIELANFVVFRIIIYDFFFCVFALISPLVLLIICLIDWLFFFVLFRCNRFLLVILFFFTVGLLLY